MAVSCVDAEHVADPHLVFRALQDTDFVSRTHFAIHKRAQAGKVVTCVLPLCPDERVEEIARMAGGETVGEATRRHARALLESAGQLPVSKLS